MANRKISELDELTGVSTTDLLPIVHNDITYKVTSENLLKSLDMTPLHDEIVGTYDTILAGKQEQLPDGTTKGDLLTWNTSTSTYSSTAQVISLPYSNLLALVSGSGLVAGQKYLINDYKSKHLIPNTSDLNIPSTEPIIVTAISINQFEPIAISPSFPNDIIYYEFTSDQSAVSGSDTGYIYRRIDTVNNNDIPFDFRSVKFRRYKLNVPTVPGSGLYAPGVAVRIGTDVYVSMRDGNFGDGGPTSPGMLGDYFRKPAYTNNTYLSPISSEWYMAVSSSHSDLLTFQDYTNVYNNKFEGNSTDILTSFNNVFYTGSVFNNNIGCRFTNNTIVGSFQNNNIGSNFGSTFGWLIDDGFQLNDIPDGLVAGTWPTISFPTYNHIVYQSFTKRWYLYYSYVGINYYTSDGSTWVSTMLDLI